jgi:hypothetical protein
MSCSSAIYTSSQNVDVAPNGVIPFGSINRRFGCNCQLSGNDIVCSGRGYYLVSVTASVTPDAAGLIGIQLYADGSPVPGADAYATGTADATVPLSITPVLVRVRCDAAKSLSVRLVSGDATTGAVVMSTHATVAKV